MKKRILSIIMALTLCLSLLPTSALALAGTAGDCNYVDANGKAHSTGGCEPVISAGSTWSGGWYQSGNDSILIRPLRAMSLSAAT